MSVSKSTLRYSLSEALDKKEEEGICRACLRPDGSVIDGEIIRLECAHTIGRDRQDEIVVGPRGGETRVVKRESTVPLCGDCHRAFHAHRLDLLPYMTLEEQLDAVRAAGGILSALKRVSGPEARLV